MNKVTGYLLDTNVVLELFRGNPRGDAIDARFGLRDSLKVNMISVITVGEMLYLGRRFAWDHAKIGKLRELLDQITWLDIDHAEILEAYGEIAAHLKGRPIGDNDVWIAATARAANLTLLTTDPDFDRLQDNFINRIWIDPRTGEPA